MDAHIPANDLTVHGQGSGDECISARGAKLGGIACTHDECSRWLYLARNNEHAENAMLLTALLCSRVGHRPITVFGSASDTISNVVIEPVRKIKPMWSECLNLNDSNTSLYLELVTYG